MRDIEILLDLFEAQQQGMSKELEQLSEETLNWRPDNEANSIAVTLWHLGRVADFVLTHRLEGRPVEEQRWFSGGWAEKTGYDPRGIGSRGMGILTGYTQTEVAALPQMRGRDLLAYHDQVYQELQTYLQNLPERGLDAPVPGEGDQRTSYFWSRVILLDATRHLGEIQALKAMYNRTIG